MRYLLAGDGGRVTFPFNLRWLLPLVCRNEINRWWVVWLASWPIAGAGMYLFASASLEPWHALAAVAFLLALPGVLGPITVRPVGVDLPGMAVALLSAGCFAHGWIVAGVAVAFVAAAVKEAFPVWIALWAWTPWALIALAGVAVAYLVRRPELDRITAGNPILMRVHDHPFRSSLEHHQGMWRSAWVMVAPWGVCLAGLVEPSIQLVAALAVAYLLLLVVTDTVRVYQPAAGPAMALAAAGVIPTQWLLLAVVVHVVWWQKPVFG